MPKPKKYRFIDPNFNDYCHYILSNLSHEEKLRLEPDERKLLSTPKVLLKFCTDGDFEKKLLLMAKVGIRFSLNFSPKNVDTSSIKDFYKQYQKDGNRREIIEQMAKEKVFVLSSFQMLLTSFYLHQNCQSDFYRLNRTFAKAKELHKMLSSGDNQHFRLTEDVKDISAGADYMIHLAYHLKKHNMIFQACGLQHDMDFLILLFLAQKENRTTFVEDKVIYFKCNDGSFKVKSFTRRIAWLYQHSYLEKMSGDKYAICDKGIQVVMEIMKRISELIHFEK